jgi:uncharacterized phage protein (TIGR02218 family)
MKSASAATLAILAAGQYFKAELYTFVIAGGSTYRFTTSQMPITVGANTYGTGLTIKRGGITQKAGLEVQGLELDIAPQPDSPNAPILISGAPFLQAVRSGVFDGCRVSMSKIFLTDWNDTSPGAVPWTQGRVNEASAGRQSAHLTINDDIEILNVAMPRNVVQAGCGHTLYDSGCTLLKSSFQSSGTVSGSPTQLSFNTNLTQANGYFDLGILTFTSGPNNGASYVVKSYVNASGKVTFVRPTAALAVAGNTFTIAAGCDKRQATCSSKFSNLVHFDGKPYVPVPETLYDGGVQSGQVEGAGGQGGPAAGSAFGAIARSSWP